MIFLWGMSRASRRVPAWLKKVAKTVRHFGASVPQIRTVVAPQDGLTRAIGSHNCVGEPGNTGWPGGFVKLDLPWSRSG